MSSYIAQLFLPIIRRFQGNAVQQITRRQDRIARTVDVNTAKNLATIDSEINSLRSVASSAFVRLQGLLGTGAVDSRQNAALVKARTQIENALDQLDAAI